RLDLRRQDLVRVPGIGELSLSPSRSIRRVLDFVRRESAHGPAGLALDVREQRPASIVELILGRDLPRPWEILRREEGSVRDLVRAGWIEKGRFVPAGVV